MAGFGYYSNLTAIINCLKAHNTTTASPDLSASLTSRLSDDNVLADDPEVVEWRADRLPALFVRISNKEEESGGLGNTGANGAQKMATVRYDVIGMYPYEGGSGANQTALNEVYNMARNIEAVFQQEHNLSGTALYCNPGRTNFMNPFNLNGTWIKTVLVELEASYIFR